jgi:hypothetical protein
MRRSLRPLLLFLMLGLLVPGPAVAGETANSSAELYDYQCRKGSGGANGKGLIKVRVRAEEYGRSRIRRFIVRLTWERLRPIGWLDWADNAQIVDTVYSRSGKFPNDASDHYFTAGAQFDFKKNSDWTGWGNKIEVFVTFQGKRTLGSWYTVNTISRRTGNCTGASTASVQAAAQQPAMRPGFARAV